MAIVTLTVISIFITSLLLHHHGSLETFISSVSALVFINDGPQLVIFTAWCYA